MVSVASPLDVPKPTIFHVAYLNVLRVSGVLGLASIVDSLKVWRGFLLEIVTLYQEWIRLPIYKAFMLLWPVWWPTPPRIGVDLLIVWSAFFAAASYHVYYEDGRNIFAHIYAKENHLRSTRIGALFRTITKVLTIFVIMPISGLCRVPDGHRVQRESGRARSRHNPLPCFGLPGMFRGGSGGGDADEGQREGRRQATGGG